MEHFVVVFISAAVTENYFTYICLCRVFIAPASFHLLCDMHESHLHTVVIETSLFCAVTAYIWLHLADIWILCIKRLILYELCVVCRYPEARAIQRKIVYHAGPTNSGKTHHALERFMNAKSGVYCGPLRLLAFQVFQKLNDLVSESLLTVFLWTLCNHSYLYILVYCGLLRVT